VKVTAAEIIAKIPELPKGFEKLVHTKGPGHAEVESFSNRSRKPYTVHIQSHSTDPGDRSILDVVCSCPATKPWCKHVVAFYAVAKELVPTEGSSEEGDTPQGGEAKQTGSEMIAEGIEMVVNGIALAVVERVGEK